MLKAICRLGDTATGQCVAHSNTRNWTGTIDTVSGGYDVAGVQGAVEDDSGLADCGHRFRIFSSSPISKNGIGKGVARVDDLVVMIPPGIGSGVLVTGSEIVFSE
jgi:hypothetical protein